MINYPRYKCTCDPRILLEHDDEARFKRMVTLELPQWSLDRKRRVSEGLSSTVAVDQCIAEPIQYLWDLKIETLGNCCGHNVFPAIVVVHEKDVVRMEELGFKRRPINKNGHYHNTFYL